MKNRFLKSYRIFSRTAAILFILMNCLAVTACVNVFGKTPTGLFGIGLGEKFDLGKFEGTKEREESMYSPGSPLNGKRHIDYSIKKVPEGVTFFSKYSVQTTGTGLIYGISAKGKANCSGDRKEYEALRATLIEKYGKPTEEKFEVGMGPEAEWTYKEKPRKYQLSLTCWVDEVNIFLSKFDILLNEAEIEKEKNIAPEKERVNRNGL